MASRLITKGMGNRSYITSRATLGVLFLVLLSIPAAELLMELILYTMVLSLQHFPMLDIHILVSVKLNHCRLTMKMWNVNVRQMGTVTTIVKLS